jgi:2-phosphosulfolactate phosphatase
MKIDVALLPGQRFDKERSVCVVVDVLRASSSIVTLLERGAPLVVAARDVEEARRLRELLPGYLLCGERDGLPPPGFDYGNSPSQFSRLDLSGKPVILATSNGTRILAALADAPFVFAGCLLNRKVVARAATAIARERGLNIAVVCSAAYGGSTFVLEDALGAGAIVDAAVDEEGVQALDAALFARDAFAVAKRDLQAAVASASHARELIDAGLGDDVSYCAGLDRSGVAPILGHGENGTLTLRAFEQNKERLP